MISFRSSVIFLIAGITLCISLLTAGEPDEVPSLEFIGIQVLPTNAKVDGVLLNELSAITYDPNTDRFLAINDSPGAGAAHIFELDLQYDFKRFHSAQPVNARPLCNVDGSTFPDIDAEGLSRGPDGHLYISTEGRVSINNPLSRDPAILVFDNSSLRLIGTLPVPEKFLARNAGNAPTYPGHRKQTVGIQGNLGFEGIAISPDGQSLYVVNEAALLQDDNRAPFDDVLNHAHGSASRIVKFQRQNDGSWISVAEKVYRSDTGSSFWIGNRFNTVADLLAIDNSGRLLVLERGLIGNNLNTGSYRIRIYAVDFSQPDATDVADVPALAQLPPDRIPTELNKFLVWEGSAGLDNIEGMTWGRQVNGRRSLILISDNSSSRRQQTQILAFATNLDP